MTWPRSLALAEVYWSPKNQKDWNNFVDRMEAQFPRLDKSGTKYATSFNNAIVKPVKANNTDSLAVMLSSELEGTEIYYTFDGTDPDNHSPKYKGEPVIFWKGADEIRVIVYKGNHPIGKQVNLKIDELKERLK
jgi:hexosaminidase